MISQKSIAGFLVPFFLSLPLSAQHIDLNAMSEEQIFARMDTTLENMLGDACGVGGYPSEPVIWMTECIRASKIGLVRSLIYAKNPSVQFLASTLCETLEQERMISLSTIEKEKVNGIKRSEAKVQTCSGCTFHGSTSLSSFYDCRNGTCVNISQWTRIWAYPEVKDYQDRKKTEDSLFAYLQDSVESEIGFGCGPGGVMTRSVAHMQILMQESKTGIIRRLLYSSNPSVQYLSAQLCEHLQQEKLIVMTKEEKKEVAAIKISKALTGLCSGCTYQEEISLNDLAVSENKEISKFRRNIKSWADQQVKEYKKVLNQKR